MIINCKRMKRKMTRIDAANLLGVDPQTITNWVERGLLGGYCDKKSRRFYVNGDDVERYAEQYKMLSVSEETLMVKTKEFRDKEREIDAKFDLLLKDELLIQKANDSNLRECLVSLYVTLSNRGERSTNVIADFLMGGGIASIADKYSLTRERIRQIIVKGLRAFAGDVENCLFTLKENGKLKEDVQNLKNKLAVALGASEHTEKQIVLPTVFSTRLVDLNISVRSLNAMKTHDIETVGDLVQYSMSELLKTRNFGKKSLSELDDLVQSLGLHWGMSAAKIYAKGMQQIRDVGKMDSLFRGVLANLSGDMAKRYNLGVCEATNRAFEEMARFVDRVRKESEINKQISNE